MFLTRTELQKLRCLGHVLRRNPREGVGRILTHLENRCSTTRKQIRNPPCGSLLAVQQALTAYRAPEQPLIDDEISAVEAGVRANLLRLPASAPFERGHSAGMLFGRLCYVACRAIQPEIVVETGVAYGVTTSFILAALSRNACGVLHSIDLPPLGNRADDFVGYIVPQQWRASWILHRGLSRQVLPALLPKLGRVDLFCHDSLHTHRNMLYEFNSVLPWLTPKSAILSDDIELNTAFADLVSRSNPAHSATFADTAKNNLCGICLYRPAK